MLNKDMLKHYINAGISDVLGFAKIIALGCFLWKMDHFYATLIIGLYVMKGIAQIIFKYQITMDTRKKLNEAAQLYLKQMEKNKNDKTEA